MAVFLIATVLPVHMGALALVGGVHRRRTSFRHRRDEYDDAVFGGFPGSLFVVLVGVTYLFAIAKNNGTVDWLVHAAVKAVRRPVAPIPWAMFAVTGALTAIGGVVPAVVAIIAPVGMSFARRYSINPVLMGLFIINGATAGGFSPLSVFGVIANTGSRIDLTGSPLFLFLASLVINILLVDRRLLPLRRPQAARRRPVDTSDTHERRLRRRAAARRGTGGTPATARRPPAQRRSAEHGQGGRGGPPPPPTARRPADDRSSRPRGRSRASTGTGVTLVGLLLLVVGALVFDLDIGLMAIGVGVSALRSSPRSAPRRRRPDRLADRAADLRHRHLRRSDAGPRPPSGWVRNVAGLAPPLVAALLICYIGGVVSAFASTTGILGALIPLAVPFLQARRRRRGRPDHRAGAVLVDRRLQPVLDHRRPGGRQRHRGGAGLRFRDPDDLGLLDGRAHPAGHLAGPGGAGLAVRRPTAAGTTTGL